MWTWWSRAIPSWRRAQSRAPAAARPASSSPGTSAPGGWPPATEAGRWTWSPCAAGESQRTSPCATSPSTRWRSRSPEAISSTRSEERAICGPAGCGWSGPGAFEQDPLRVLRLVRAAVELTPRARLRDGTQRAGERRRAWRCLSRANLRRAAADRRRPAGPSRPGDALRARGGSGGPAGARGAARGAAEPLPPPGCARAHARRARPDDRAGRVLGAVRGSDPVDLRRALRGGPWTSWPSRWRTR